jgi:hypothetical protein
MHNSVIILDDGSRAELSFYVYEEKIHVIVVGDSTQSWAADALTTPLLAKEHCEASLLVPRAANGWDLEITTSRLLGILT